MSRYIDADALMENTKHLADACYGAERVCEKTKFQKMIKNAPTISAVPVVRCGECKKKYTPNSCPLMYGRITSTTGNDEWFCANGERKDGEND